MILTKKFQYFTAARILILLAAFILCFGVKCEAEEFSCIAKPPDAQIIPVEKLRPTEKFTAAEISAVKRNIELIKIGKKPLLKPLTVIERGDGTYSVIEGSKTLAAMKELGAKNLPAIIKPYPYQKGVYSIEDLYALNVAAEDEYNTLMQNLQQELGGELKVRPYIKKEQRVREKTRLEYDGDYSYVTDMWAASLLYPDEKSLLAAFDKIKQRDDVIWINDRWHNPLPQGYRDIQLCLLLSNGAVIELQLHHKAIFEANSAVSHRIYEFVRSNMKKPEMQECVQRAQNCQKILFESALNGKFATVDDATKKEMAALTLELSKQTSPKKAAQVLDKLEKFLRDNLTDDEYEAAA